MKFFLFTISLCLLGIVYINYQAAKSTSEENIRFVISQSSNKGKPATAIAKVAEPRAVNSAFSANLLTPPNSASKQSTPTTPIIPVTQPSSPAHKVQSPVSEELQLIKSTPSQTINSWAKGQAMTFVFNQPVNLDSFFSHFSIKPSKDGKFSGDITFGGNNSIVVVTPIPMLKENTQYTIQLSAGLQSLDGKKTMHSSYSYSVTIVP